MNKHIALYAFLCSILLIGNVYSEQYDQDVCYCGGQQGKIVFGDPTETDEGYITENKEACMYDVFKDFSLSPFEVKIDLECLPLHQAIIRNDKETVKKYLDSKELHKLSPEFKLSPLHCAIIVMGYSVVAQLLKTNIDLNAQDSKGYTALHYAIRLGDSDLFRPLLEKGAKVTTATKDSEESPLHDAALNGDPLAVQLLLDHGSSANYKSIGGLTPLHYVGYVKSGHCRYPGRKEVVRLLVKAGADINALDSEGFTPLHLAAEEAYKNDYEIVVTLLESGANVNVGSMYGQTPLFLAAMHGNVTAARYLVLFGATINLSSRGSMPLHAAAAQKNPAIVETFLDRGAAVNALDNGGNTALHHAAAHGRIKTIKLLVKAGIDIFKKNADGQTALDVARKNSHKRIAKFLQKEEQGSDIEKVDAQSCQRTKVNKKHKKEKRKEI